MIYFLVKPQREGETEREKVGAGGLGRRERETVVSSVPRSVTGRLVIQVRVCSVASKIPDATWGCHQQKCQSVPSITRDVQDQILARLELIIPSDHLHLKFSREAP